MIRNKSGEPFDRLRRHGVRPGRSCTEVERQVDDSWNVDIAADQKLGPSPRSDRLASITALAGYVAGMSPA